MAKEDMVRKYRGWGEGPGWMELVDEIVTASFAGGFNNKTRDRFIEAAAGAGSPVFGVNTLVPFGALVDSVSAHVESGIVKPVFDKTQVAAIGFNHKDIKEYKERLEALKEGGEGLTLTALDVAEIAPQKVDKTSTFTQAKLPRRFDNEDEKVAKGDVRAYTTRIIAANGGLRAPIASAASGIVPQRVTGKMRKAMEGLVEVLGDIHGASKKEITACKKKAAEKLDAQERVVAALEAESPGTKAKGAKAEKGPKKGRAA